MSTKSRLEAPIETVGWKYENVQYLRRFLPTGITLLILLWGIWSFTDNNAHLIAPPVGDLIGQDFRQVLRASQELQQGQNIYQHALPFARDVDFAEFMHWEASPYPYSPFPAVLGIPLLTLGMENALVFWTVMNWCLLMATAWFAARAFASPDRIMQIQGFALVAVLILFYGPGHIALKLGQLDISLLFLLSLAYVLYKRRSAPSIPLAFAIALKPILAPIMLFFLWKRQWKTVLVTGVLCAALTIFGFTVAGWELLPDYIEVNRLWATSDMLSFPFNQSVNGFTIRLFTENAYIVPLFEAPVLAHILRYGIAALALILWVMLMSREDQRDQPANGVEYGFTLTTMLFITPLVDDVHFTWVIIPIAALLLALLSGSLSRAGWGLLIVSTLCTLYLAHPDLHDAAYRGYESLLRDNVLLAREYNFLTNAYLYGLVGLHGCLILYLLMHRMKRKPADV